MSSSDVLDTALQTVETDENLKEAKENRPTLRKVEPKKAAKMMRRRWDRLEPVMRRKQAELKVNFLRYSGEQFAQVNPRDPNRVLRPKTTDKRHPPVLNRMRIAVQRFVAQVTADEPVIEGLPARHRNEDRDAAEAATHALRGEWHRLSLQRELQRAAHVAAIFRSGFWFFEWDDVAGGKSPAEKFFVNPETNERYVAFADADGNEVDDPDDAAEIWKGSIAVEVMTPMNVRWTGGRYAHEADELMVAKIVRLRHLYSAFPKTRKEKLHRLLGNVPAEAEKWLQDIRGENFRSGLDMPDDVNLEEITGHELEDDSDLLDQPVFMLHYFLKPDKRYESGFHGITAGGTTLFRGSLRYGVFPIAHFKLKDEISEPLGLSLIDMLKDPQELLDFVRGQILRHLQMMRRRWFMPQQANVSARDLMNPSRTVIEYNAKAGKPEAETQPELSNSIFEFLEHANEDFNDIWGLHETSQGKHVPGVSSGRHAEALRTGDETLLGLTRSQFKTGLEHAGLVMLKMIKKEWTMERRVRYMGNGRQFVDKAFSRTDFRDTSDVRLRESTLLMLSKAQKLETIFGYAEMGVLDPQEIRRLAPLADTAGISLTEDTHVQKARRQSERMLSGPTDEAEEAHEVFAAENERLTAELERLQERAATLSPEVIEPLVMAVQEQIAESQEQYDAVMQRAMPLPGPSEMLPHVAMIHVEEHADALASQKADRLPAWWVDWFVQHHFMADVQASQPPQPEEGQPEASGGLGPEQVSALANPGDLPAPGLQLNAG